MECIFLESFFRNTDFAAKVLVAWFLLMKIFIVSNFRLYLSTISMQERLNWGFFFLSNWSIRNNFYELIDYAYL